MLRATRKASTPESGPNGTTSPNPVSSSLQLPLHVPHSHGPPWSHTPKPSAFQIGMRERMACLIFAMTCLILVLVGHSLSGTGATRLASFLPLNLSRHRVTLSLRDNDAVRVDYDVVVIGAGPAGLTAALFGARAGLHVLVVGSDQGQLSEATRLDNFPSFVDMDDTEIVIAPTGMEWLHQTKVQAARAGVHYAQAGWLVTRVEIGSQPIFTVHVGETDHTVTSASIIVASGAVPQRLGLPSEDVLWGTAVHSCAICDGSQYYRVHHKEPRQTVVVVGGGDAAVDAALLLARHVDVIVVHRRSTFRASNAHNVHALLHHDNIIVYTPYVVREYNTVTRSAASDASRTPTQLQGVTIVNVDTQTTTLIECQGVFVLIGSQPNTAFLQGVVPLQESGLIALQPQSLTATMVEGIFAAGEVTDATYKQAITAAAAGAQAAIDVERWLHTTTSSTPTARAGTSRDTLDLESNGRHDAATTVLPLQDTARLVRDATARTAPLTGMQPARSATDDSELCHVPSVPCVEWILGTHAVVVFRAPDIVELLHLDPSSPASRHFDAYVVTLYSDERSQRMQEALAKVTGQSVVLPMVFVSGKNIGTEQALALDANGQWSQIMAEALAHPVRDKTDDCDLTKEACLLDVVNRHPVVIFSKTYCPYCKKALELFNLEGVPESARHVIDLDTLEQMNAIQDVLLRMTGRRTVPNIFIGGVPVGGYDQTEAWHHEGKLRPLLEDANAL